MDGPAGHAPIAFAHRGARAERRENTIESFSLALELGATGLESDAWLTRDGVVVLEHDGVTGPMWRRRKISSARRRDLARHVPALEDLYRACGAGFELSLDVKDPAAFEPILSVARSAGDPSRLWLCHGDQELLAGWRGTAGDVRLVESTRRSKFAGSPGRHAQVLAEVGIAALNLRWDDWTPEAIADVQAAGVRAFGWGAQSDASIAALIRAGADAIYSDHVDRMARAIAASQPAESRQRPDPDERPSHDQAPRDRSDDP